MNIKNKSLGRTLAIACTLAGWWSSAPPAQATSYVPMTDEALADQAPLIVEVEVLERMGPSATGSPVTDYRVRIVRGVKGAAPAELVVRVAGGTRPDGSGLQLWAAPRFRVGQQALLFLSRHRDGTYRILQFMLGAFHIRDLAGRRVAWRDLSEARAVGPASRPEAPRDLERFVAWLRDRAQGRRRPADYEAGASDGFVGLDFTLLGPGRWTEFDGGGNVPWRAHQSGQSGMPGGGFARFQSALLAWNTDPNTPINLAYSGTTTATGGLSARDFVNAILFDDPFNDIPGSFSCTGGGTLAVGGFWSSGTVTWKGQTFSRAVEGDIVTQDGAGCFYGGNLGEDGEEVFGHELGHTIGLGHSCGDGSSGPCNTPDKDAALMRAFAHGDGRGALLGNDDRNGIIFLYQASQVASVAFAAANSSFAEGAGTIQVTVVLSTSTGPLTSAVTVNWATAGGSATSGSDFVPGSGTITFPVGSPSGTSQAIGVALVSDIIDEPNESFSLNLSNPVNASLGSPSTHVVTILDDDPTPQIAIQDCGATEGDSGTTPCTFNLTLSGPSSATVTVNYGTADGTAQTPSDYVYASGTVSFAPLQTANTLDVLVNGDLLDESDESFVVNLANASGATIADPQGQATITDDDQAAASVSDASGLEGVAGPNTLTFTISLSNPSVQTVTVPWSTADGSATAGSDYASASDTVAFLPGEVSQLVSVTVFGDTTVEGPETVLVNLGPPTNAIVADGQGVGTIVNDDPPTAAALADFVMLGQSQRTTLSDTIVTRWFKVRLAPGRSYAATLWAPATDLAESPVSLQLAWFLDDGATPAAGATVAENEPIPEAGGHDGAAASIIPPAGECVIPTGCTYRLRLQATGAVAPIEVRMMVVETTLISPYWQVVTAAGYDAAPQVRNNTPAAIPVTFTAYGSGGSVVCSNTFTIPAHGLTTFGLSGGAPGCGISSGFGSAELAFHGPPGSITANTTTFSALSGLSFDAPFRPRNTWTSLRTH